MSRRKKARKQLGYSFRKLGNANWQFRVANGTFTPECKTFADFDSGKIWADRRAALIRNDEHALGKLGERVTLESTLRALADPPFRVTANIARG